MKVLRGDTTDWLRPDSPTALAVGVFDGVHAGHRAVIAALLEAAGRRRLTPGVVTFDPHPLEVVAPERAPAVLTGLEQRVELLGDLGVELVAIVPFDVETREWSADRFVELLTNRLAAALLVIGEDFRFGRDRIGDAAFLVAAGLEQGFETIVLSLVGEPVPASSSAIRRMLAEGDVEAAAAALGRPHEAWGVIPEGEFAALQLPAGIAVPAPGRYLVTLGRGAGESSPAEATIVHEGGPSVDLIPHPGSGPWRVRFLSVIDRSSGRGP